MTREEITVYCLAKPGAYEDQPFGEFPICYKVNKKIFAQVYPNMVTLKCTAFSGQMFRQNWPGVVVRGYHCPPVQQPYWNTIYLDKFPAEELPYMIDHAYETVLSGFSRNVQQEILENSK